MAYIYREAKFSFVMVVVQAWVLDGKEFGAGSLGRFVQWLLGFESKGQDLQGLAATEEKQGLEMPVVHCRGGKEGEEEKQDLAGSNCNRLAEKFCQLSAAFDCWLI